MKKTILFFYLLFFTAVLYGEDGYRLWLRYDKINDAALLQRYRNEISSLVFTGSSPTMTIAKNELVNDLEALLATKIIAQKNIANKCILAGTSSTSTIIQS